MLRFRNAINDFGQIPAGLFRFDEISALSLIRRNVYFLTVDKKVAMIYQLSCPSSIGCKTHTIDDVVKTSLEQLKEHRSPFRNSFSPSLRQILHKAPKYLATLNSPLFGWPATVVRDWCNIFYKIDLETCCRECPDSRFPPCTGPFYKNINLFHPKVHCLFCYRSCCYLCSIGSPFS